MKERRILHMVIGILLCGCISAQQDVGYYFYSQDDIKNIKQSARTSWGKEILDNFRQIVTERKRHPMEIPELEGGHGHDYYCPVHNTRFVFNWNSSKGHYCRMCNKEWKGVDKYDWAWVNFVHAENLKYLMANMYLFIATDQKEYARNIKELLLDLAGKYPEYKEHDRERRSNPGYDGKLFGQSLDEAVWAIDAARAYLVAASEMKVSERKKIASGFLRPCADLLMKSHDKGNWQVWHNGGIIALGVALKNDSIIDVALHKPELGYYDMLEKNVYNDGWWNEGSVVYHFYPLRGLLLSAEALRCRNINLYDRKLINMFSSPVNMLYPDLTFPSQNDGWYGTTLISQCGLYEIMALRCQDPVFVNLLELCYKHVKRTSAEALINGMELSEDPEPLQLKSSLFPDLGVGMLRSGKQTVAIKFGPSGGIHGHPDKLSISIHDGHKELLPDLGTTAYGVPDCRLWYQKTFSHNTVTVDEADQLKSSGNLLRFDPAEDGGTIVAEANDAYKKVGMQRVIHLAEDKLSDQFVCRSEKEHLYDYVLILTEPVEFGGIKDANILKKYDRISEVVRKTMSGPVTFTLSGGTQIVIQVNSQENYELISGVAPGIPPTGIQEGGNVYPLIIRVKDKILDIKTRWKFSN